MAVHLPEVAYSSEQLAELSKASLVFERILPYFDVYFERRTDEVVSNLTTNRDKVIAATSEKAVSVSEIERRTGLIKRKIWGVLSAPDLVFAKTKVNGETHYQFDKAVPRPNPTVKEATTENLKIR